MRNNALISVALKLATTLITLAVISTPLHARPNPAGKNVYFLVTTGLTFGGDRLATVDIIDAFDDEDRVDIDAGQLFYLAGGVIIPFGRTGFSIQSTIGWHTDGVSADNGDASFERFPLELLSFYTIGQHRFGGGISYIFSPELDLKDINNATATFDDTLGFIAEYGYFFSNTGIMLGARYQYTEFELESTQGNSGVGNGDVDGSYFGITFGFSF